MNAGETSGVVIGVVILFIILIITVICIIRKCGNNRTSNTRFANSVRSILPLHSNGTSEVNCTYGTNSTTVSATLPQGETMVEEDAKIPTNIGKESTSGKMRMGLAAVAEPSDCIVVDDSMTSFLHRRRSSLSSNDGHLGQIRPDLYQKKNSVLMQSVDATQEMGRVLLQMRYDMHTSDFILIPTKVTDLPPKLSAYCLVIQMHPPLDKKERKCGRTKVDEELDCKFKYATTYEELIERTLSVKLMDWSRYPRVAVQIGQVDIELRDVDPSADIKVWADFESKSVLDLLGEVLCSLNYFSSAERLTVTLHQARNLKKMDLAGKADGKRLKRRRTATCKNTLDPVWNEAFEFDIKEQALGDTCIDMDVMDYDMISNDELIGKIVLGSKVGHTGHQSVWKELIHRKSVTNQWLSILDSDVINNQSSQLITS